jgi:hypothetical protein
MIQTFGFKHVSNKLHCFDELCQWPWKIWPLPNTKIIFSGMPQDDEKIISLECVDLS